MTAILGYARVSTLGQDLDAQLAVLADEGVKPGQMFTDKLSGAVNTNRPGLAALLHYAREGDTVVVTAIDRPGRSVAEVTRTIAELGERRTLLRALHEGIDTDTPTGRAVAAIMATRRSCRSWIPTRTVQCSAVQCSAYSCWPPRLIDSETTTAPATDDLDHHARPAN